MAFFVRESISITGSTAGATTAYSTGVFNGFLQTYRLSGTVNKLVSLIGADSAITFHTITPSSGTALYAPVQVGRTSTGAVAAWERIPIVNERLKITVAQTTSARASTLIVSVGG